MDLSDLVSHLTSAQPGASVSSAALKAAHPFNLSRSRASQVIQHSPSVNCLTYSCSKYRTLLWYPAPTGAYGCLLVPTGDLVVRKHLRLACSLSATVWTGIVYLVTRSP